MKPWPLGDEGTGCSADDLNEDGPHEDYAAEWMKKLDKQQQGVELGFQGLREAGYVFREAEDE